MQIVQNSLLFFHLYYFYHNGKLQGVTKEYEIGRNFKLCCGSFKIQQIAMKEKT
jgi:hypothetical protein